MEVSAPVPVVWEPCRKEALPSVSRLEGFGSVSDDFR